MILFVSTGARFPHGFDFLTEESFAELGGCESWGGMLERRKMEDQSMFRLRGLRE